MALEKAEDTKSYKFRDLLEKWGLSSLRINLHFLEMEFQPNDKDRYAAWEMYIELLTRVTTQYLAPDHGDEQTALESVHKLFQITREILRNHGSQCKEFAKIAIVVLNQKIRPFTAKWHPKSIAGGLEDGEECAKFREELKSLQVTMRKYTRLLAYMAQVEDLTDLESQD